MNVQDWIYDTYIQAEERAPDYCQDETASGTSISKKIFNKQSLKRQLDGTSKTNVEPKRSSRGSNQQRIRVFSERARNSEMRSSPQNPLARLNALSHRHKSRCKLPGLSKTWFRPFTLQHCLLIFRTKQEGGSQFSPPCYWEDKSITELGYTFKEKES